jgi:hypothetical protein
MRSCVRQSRDERIWAQKPPKKAPLAKGSTACRQAITCRSLALDDVHLQALDEAEYVTSLRFADRDLPHCRGNR